MALVSDQIFHAEQLRKHPDNDGSFGVLLPNGAYLSVFADGHRGEQPAGMLDQEKIRKSKNSETLYYADRRYLGGGVWPVVVVS